MGTIGEYIKTKAAQAEADHHVRKTLNYWLRDGRLISIKMHRGKKGTLNYGRYLIMLQSKPAQSKLKPLITILWGDFGLHARAVSGKIDNQHWKFYRQKAAAYKKYEDLIKYYLD